MIALRRWRKVRETQRETDRLLIPLVLQHGSRLFPNDRSFCLRRFANLVTDQGLVAMRNLSPYCRILVTFFLLPAVANCLLAQDGRDSQPLRDQPLRDLEANDVSVLDSTSQRSAPAYAQDLPDGASPASPVAVDFQPYQVFVSHADAYAHCGPSDEFYRTDPLRFGQTLEVYTETSDGWLGIRPPEDSFCWLPAETVQLDSNTETGTVIEDRTVCWIGTQLGRARQYRWQVQLAKGEMITVIGRSEREGPDGPQLWYRIVPPSGEYRWVFRDDVVESTEALVQIAQNRSNPPSRTEVNENGLPSNLEPRFANARTPVTGMAGSESSRLQDRETLSERSVLEGQRPIGSGIRQTSAGQTISGVTNRELPSEPRSAMDVFREDGLLASLEYITSPKIQDIGAQPQTGRSGSLLEEANTLRQAPRSRTYPDNSSWVSSRSDRLGNRIRSGEGGFQPTIRGSSLDRSSQQSIMPVTATQAVDPAVIASRVTALRQEVMGADLDRLNLLLSRLMASQASAAELEVIVDSANQLGTQTNDSLVRQRARILVETAQRYQGVTTRRNGGVAAASFVTPMQSEQRSGSSVNVIQAADANSAIEPSVTANHGTQGDVVRQEGYLVQVYSARSNSPPFALTDSSGRTLAYLSPMPGINLRTHLNQQVSVVGTVGTVAGLDTPHLMVTQAVRMGQ